MRGPFVALLIGLALGLGAGACSFTPALQAYCDETQLCACEGDDCCIKSANSCEDGLCCGRLVCTDGFCGQGPDQPFLAITPPGIDFGVYDRTSVNPAPFQVFTVTNVGTQPTGPLQRRTLGNVGDLTVSEDGCANRALAPGQSCTTRVDVTPTSAGFKELRLAYFESSDVDTTVTITALVR
ncbi:hypothetical protein FGE12_13220 [Aggregicoccus sp. 17bor-14]|uniref:hypothetical protein n=1 Tax=Myxococcaceae TaxID=31 RepID=UPI00129CDED6|nr:MULTISPECIES: hypothetical protein [Myxococcaceae]MBF5043352.1 hypothetical protein [Simulacricoccus sp. 17bor-14]MRI89111.1 hypothetical protein [Aggregicoccus sp. 17bor-14]